VAVMPKEPALALFDAASLPEGACIQEVFVTPLEARAVITLTEAAQVAANRFAFPGWQAEVDGERAPVTPTDPHGLISFPVPAGRHEITLRFGTTPLRLGATLVSLGSLALGAGFLLRRQGPWRPRRRTVQEGLSPMWLLLPLIILLLHDGVLAYIETPLQRRRLQAGNLTGVDIPADVTFDHQLRLLGYETLPATLHAGAPLPLTLHVQDTIPGGPRYLIFPELVDAAGEVWSDFPYTPTIYKPPPPWTPDWPPDQYATLLFDLWPKIGTPPGQYMVRLKVFDHDTRFTYTAYDGMGQALGTELILGEVAITRPLEPFEIDTLAPPSEHLNIPPVSVRLVWAATRPAHARPGDQLYLQLGWETVSPPGEALYAQLHLTTETSAPMLLDAVPLVRDDFPTSQWKAGDVWRGQHTLRLPAQLENGDYILALQLCTRKDEECTTTGPIVEIERVAIEAPDRLWEAPPLDLMSGVTLGEYVTLLGANLTPGPQLEAGKPLNVILAWRGEHEMETSYRVFLHLLDANGQLTAQADGEPAHWQRPTTGWLPGEIVLDERVLLLPAELAPGTYRLETGLYTLDGSRLKTEGGQTTTPVGNIHVSAADD
ncbi:MAG: hypothetical protein JXB35_00430, partial [Anaerolineae bacterium]|nr:hypothetical protein [Anaerolineae bacterium]